MYLGKFKEGVYSGKFKEEVYSGFEVRMKLEGKAYEVTKGIVREKLKGWRSYMV